MAIKHAFNSLYSFTARGKVGIPNGLGRDLLGVSFLGYRDDRAAIYQNRTKQSGHAIVAMRHWIPKNPRTESQQANRNKFGDAMSAWQSLTDQEKLSYTKRGKSRGMFGHNLFIREYMLSNGE